ncbi:hypothetical protein HPB52_020995 [Rhipicephalus sanguineus]|uniref:Ketoreductase domain-containing protein n=1 Tax=Rhipicephalus sanguineus TaxID=34632 RepID=A0A9D4Q2R0_RHISA|nr:hypothetical protein HPB52_020995 [Rhipicephalus sanguineus]
MALKFDGKVVVVTGAGGGLGREYAVLFAERGASVVDSVEEGEKIIKTAIDNFGRVDILINNAGILRDKAFVNMTPDEFDLIHRVHLRGSFLVTKAAWPYFRKQGYGKVIMTASGAGIYGNFGQANYGSAKLALLGLSNTLAIEGKKYNISCNTIVPLAGSRLTEDIFPPEVFEKLKPSFVSPVVVWLCHDTCPETGGVFEAAGGYVGKYQWYRSGGKAFIGDDLITPEKVRDSWSQITDMSTAQPMASIHDQTKSLIEVLSGQAPSRPVASTAPPVDDPTVFVYNPDTVILYALAVGLSTQEKDHLKFLYEGAEDFSVLPSFGVIPAMPAVFGSVAQHEETRKLNIDPTKVTLGVHFVTLFLKEVSCFNESCFLPVSLLGHSVSFMSDTFDQHGERVIHSQWSTFFVGSGNFGGKRTTDKARPLATIPNRKPDAVIEEKTSINQAALYRLCGFPQPIMHGLCSFGYATRHVLKQYAGNDVRRFKSIKARFTGPVVPGQSIRTEMWKDGNRIIFQCSVPESNKQIISGGCVELHDVAQPPPAAPQPPLGASLESEMELKSDLVFAGMEARVEDMPELASKVKAIYEYNILLKGKPAAVWSILHCTLCSCLLTCNYPRTFSMPFFLLLQAFMTGKLKVKGNLLLMQRLRELLKPPKDSAPPKPASAPAVSSSVALKSDAIFESLEKKIANNPDLASSVQTIFQWDIKKDGQLIKQYTLDLKNGKGAVYLGTPKQGKPDCTFIMEDEILHSIFTGKLDAQRAFMTGKMKITGNVLASQKLQELWEQDKEENPEDELAAIVQSAKDNEAAAAAAAGADGERPPPPNEPPNTIKSDFIFGIFIEYQKQEPQIASIVKTGPPKGIKADVAITIDDEDVIQLMLGKLNPQKAFMTGRLKIRGNIMLTQRFNLLWQEILKSGRVVELKLMSPLLSDGKPLSKELWSDCAFFVLTKKLAHLPDLAPKVQAIYEWRILKDGKEASKWTLDLKNGIGAVYRGSPRDTPSDCTVTMDDDIFANLVAGRVTPQVAFSKFVKVEGKKELADKLHPLFLSASKL